MDEKERQKLIERRKKEQAERELQFDLNRVLKIQDRANDIAEQQEIYRNRYMDWTLTFLGTLIPLYLLLFGTKYLFMVFFGPVLGMIGISLHGINTVLHILIWSVSAYSVYRERSVMEDILEKFF